MYVYERTEQRLYTVGHYDPSGKWHAESDHDNKESAAERVHYLNGGNDDSVDSFVNLMEATKIWGTKQGK
jgi:hypothetical protein